MAPTLLCRCVICPWVSVSSCARAVGVCAGAAGSDVSLVLSFSSIGPALLFMRQPELSRPSGVALYQHSSPAASPDAGMALAGSACDALLSSASIRAGAMASSLLTADDLTKAFLPPPFFPIVLQAVQDAFQGYFQVKCVGPQENLAPRRALM